PPTISNTGPKASKAGSTATPQAGRSTTMSTQGKHSSNTIRTSPHSARKSSATTHGATNARTTPPESTPTTSNPSTMIPCQNSTGIEPAKTNPSLPDPPTQTHTNGFPHPENHP